LEKQQTRAVNKCSTARGYLYLQSGFNTCLLGRLQPAAQTQQKANTDCIATLGAWAGPSSGQTRCWQCTSQSRRCLQVAERAARCRKIEMTPSKDPVGCWWRRFSRQELHRLCHQGAAGSATFRVLLVAIISSGLMIQQPWQIISMLFTSRAPDSGAFWGIRMKGVSRMSHQ
jgi:hypothetical protein